MHSKKIDWRSKFKGFTPYFIIAIGILFLIFAVYCDNIATIKSNKIPSDGNLGRMTSGNVYSQDFVSEYDGLESVSLSLATYKGTESGAIIVSLLSGEKVIDQWNVDCYRLADNTYYTFFLKSPQKDSSKKKYTILISPVNANEKNAITAYTNSSGKYSGLSVNGQPQEGKTLCYQLNYGNVAYKYVICLILNALNSNGKTAMPAYASGKYLEPSINSQTQEGKTRDSQLNYGNVVGGIRYIIRFLLISTLIFLAWAVVQFSGLAIEKVFLAFWVLLSVLFTFSNPLFNVPDETGHFLRSYEISEGGFISAYNEEKHMGGNELPFDGVSFSLLTKSWREYDKNKDKVVVSNKRVFKGFRNEAIKSPVNYAPQALGIFIARHFSNKISTMAYAGRFVNWLFATILFYFAIKIAPKGKEFLCIVAMLPMNIHEAISLASDANVVAISAMMIALVMYLRYEQEEKLSKYQVIMLYSLALLISLYKIVYVVFCLLYLLIPEERFKNGINGKIMHASIMVVLAGGLNIYWMSIAGRFLVRKGTNAELQISYIIHYPIRYLLILIRTFMSSGTELIQQMMGTRLSHLKTRTVGLITMLCLVQLIHVTGRDRNITIVQKKQRNERLCFIAIIGVLIILISTSLYVDWTYTYSNSISGLQGRYFIPMLFLVYLATVGETYPGWTAKKESLSLFSQFVIVVSNVGACMSLLFSKL